MEGNRLADSYIDWRKTINIRPVELSLKKQYYSDLINIEHSWSGRMDSNICNTFIMEAEQQLINAIELFENGYFDCAYYSLRSAVDVSTTMVFLADMPDGEKGEFLDAWRAIKDFPMQGQMIKQLSLKGNVFADMKVKMPEFFIKAKELSAKLNKYVHKQGLQHFYISRNHPFNLHKSQDAFISTFKHYLQRCIGSSTIENYKQTDLYTGTYNSFIGEEKKSEAVFNIANYQYIDSKKMDEIFKQPHLLTKDDIISVLLVSACEKVVKVYCCQGLLMYLTDRDTNRKAMLWAGLNFKDFSEANNPINQPCDEAYISVLFFDDMPYFVEHNELLNTDEVVHMVGLVTGELIKMRTPNNE